ncbi:MAG: hypothetical protein M3Z66_25260 [Chloroflexota bacterium]|nr:hypothetical protein [Chloroflexota bacterium]
MDQVDIQPDNEYRQITVRMHHHGVVQRGVKRGQEIGTGRQYQAHVDQLIVSRIDARNGAMGLVPQGLDGAIVTNDFWLFDIDPAQADPQFLDLYAGSAPFVERCRRASEGTTNRVRLQPEAFLGLPVPLPPLCEQRRIVARLDEVMGKIEEARRLQVEVAMVARAVIPATVGRLLAGVQVTGHLGEVLAEKPRNGWSARCDGAEAGTAVLKLGAVTGWRYQPTEFKRTSVPTADGAYYWLKDGDLLITRSNTPELVGHAAIYNGLPFPCIYPDLMMRLAVDGGRADKHFVHSWLRSTLVRDHIRSTSRGTSPSMVKISQPDVMHIPFPVDLPVPEQRRIAACVEAAEAEAEQARGMAGPACSDLAALLAAIRDQAFAGQL